MRQFTTLYLFNCLITVRFAHWDLSWDFFPSLIFCHISCSSFFNSFVEIWYTADSLFASVFCRALKMKLIALLCGLFCKHWYKFYSDASSRTGVKQFCTLNVQMNRQEVAPTKKFLLKQRELSNFFFGSVKLVLLERCYKAKCSPMTSVLVKFMNSFITVRYAHWDSRPEFCLSNSDPFVTETV